MEILHKKFGLRSILIEGGAGIIQSVLELHLADQVIVTIRPCFYGGYRSLTRQLSTPVELTSTVAASVGGDVILCGQLEKTIPDKTSSCIGKNTLLKIRPTGLDKLLNSGWHNYAMSEQRKRVMFINND